jgi:transcriptional regulator with GAF, ATPase, and Fis domain
MKGHPDRVNSRDTLLQLVHLELVSEFRDCLVQDHLKKMYVTLHKQHFKSILGVDNEKIDHFDSKYILMFKIDEEELSDDEEEEEEKKEMHFVEDEQLVDILTEAYPKIRGKLNLSRYSHPSPSSTNIAYPSYDEKIVFSADYKQYFINFLRALDSDQDVILIGEKGVGKRSLARFIESPHTTSNSL